MTDMTGTLPDEPTTTRSGTMRYPTEFTLTSSDGLASIGKPFTPADLRDAMGIVDDLHLTGHTYRMHPRGFRLLEDAPQAVFGGR